MIEEYEASEFNRNYASLLPANKGAEILDLGCGKGQLLRWLKSEEYRKLVGVDNNHEAIEEAESFGLLVLEFDLIHYLKHTIINYDLIIMRHVIEHIPKNKHKHLIELLFNVLNPGGTLIIDTPNAEYILASSQRYADLEHETMFTKETLWELLQTKFKDVEIKKAVLSQATTQSETRNKILYPLASNLMNAFLRCLGIKGAWTETAGIIAIARKEGLKC